VAENQYIARLQNIYGNKWVCVCAGNVEVTAIGEVYKMNSFICSDITPCSLLKIKRCFGVTFRLQLGDRRSQARNKHEASSKQNWILAWINL
jgi:hypothetical protein